VNVSLPTGAGTCVVQTVPCAAAWGARAIEGGGTGLQFAIVTIPALPPLGVTVIATDFVDAETYCGARCTALGDAAGM
jgi:hypothetical protein